MTDSREPDADGRPGVPPWWYAAAAAVMVLGCLAVVLLSPDLKRRVNVARGERAMPSVAAAVSADPRFVDVRPSVDRTGRGGLRVSGTVTHRADLAALIAVVRSRSGTVPTTVSVIVADDLLLGGPASTRPTTSSRPCAGGDGQDGPG